MGPIEHCSNATRHLSSAAEHSNIAKPWTLIRSYKYHIRYHSDLQRDRVSCRLQTGSRNMATSSVFLYNLQQLCDTIMPTCTRRSEECFQHLVKSMRELRMLRERRVTKTRAGTTFTRKTTYGVVRL